MDVSVKLFGDLRRYLPPGSGFNHCTVELDDDARLDALLARLPLPPEQDFMVLVNDEKVERERFAEHPVGAGDDVVLLPPLKGG